VTVPRSQATGPRPGELPKSDYPKSDYPKSDYKEYPKTLDPGDFWGQVRRTIHGRRITEAEVDVMVSAIRSGLDLRPADVVLDLACGNGALSSRLFPDCSGLVGIDASEYLIEVAKTNFERSPRFTFLLDDAAHYVEAESEPGRFSKVLCYGSFSYFSYDEARRVLTALSARFVNAKKVFIGNLPDRDRASSFFPPGVDYARDLGDHGSQAGIWRSSEEWHQLAAATGWASRISFMPEDFFNAHYRFDVILERGARAD
jgi:SAM-dependent methyltransferase